MRNFIKIVNEAYHKEGGNIFPMPTRKEIFQKIRKYDGNEKPYDWLPDSLPNEPLCWYEALPYDIQKYTDESPWFYMELRYRIINRLKKSREYEPYADLRVGRSVHD